MLTLISLASLVALSPPFILQVFCSPMVVTATSCDHNIVCWGPCLLTLRDLTCSTTYEGSELCAASIFVDSRIDGVLEIVNSLTSKGSRKRLQTQSRPLMMTCNIEKATDCAISSWSNRCQLQQTYIYVTKDIIFYKMNLLPGISPLTYSINSWLSESLYK